MCQDCHRNLLNCRFYYTFLVFVCAVRDIPVALVCHIIVGGGGCDDVSVKS